MVIYNNCWEPLVMINRSGEYVSDGPPIRSSCCKRPAVSRRKSGSPSVVPYCNAAWPVRGDRRMSLSMPRVSTTGSEALSVKPAASEMSPGRASAALISQEIGVSPARCPKRERMFAFMMTAMRSKPGLP